MHFTRYDCRVNEEFLLTRKIDQDGVFNGPFQMRYQASMMGFFSIDTKQYADYISLVFRWTEMRRPY